ncbi:MULTISPECIES: ABC transporter ATP-binding protein [Chryseobacterium]|uniref:Lipopolysaccharide transport system ATP-binding protein n=1 Tax=Chryseobacterium camelliae TaxID=1265445 RepID=A0ABU0TQJ5_9FLAO|nr:MULTISPECIES: ABC transporter ATP-binding protein [Chryseobacterium]MDT3407610.1 lipopolysaccharide transport system ATP-binding protein [Pseudacidovorax intermedius]MDQ1098538.1 lipopolysaccharide transport system ATP-binding protein [Chryseobacterium camelliae]MDQ1102462.1 lipopolysaccharide transport system ATP-binding protein [Chryseobacterium sp. SORGH_AS_1048]MDR6085895.1 lipopolysaccharide transport system ATP-binding protein [Chryseobacterium sp. SORGH_AS_0909]MDR6130262.1 lipopolys
MLALKAENISKQYRLGQVGTGTLSHDLNRFWYKIRGKEDPYLKIGEANDRTQKGTSEYVWSLRDINFEIRQGDAVGIIGRNGAGKSTLLKLLSKVTKPTTGKIYTNGRIASLLEVGTGFHPEMTGRENVFLNGAILGMTRKEIARKFDEIVAFSGVERYIDTPVKRYSSGMYVRLAFAVAAHLESEILIVDEVLAVGDAEFQKKCLGKMGDVTKGEGRTILFVSHNMTAIKELCNTGILLNQGQLTYSGNILDTIVEYQKNSEILSRYMHEGPIETAMGNENIRILEFSAVPTRGKLIDIESGISVRLRFMNYRAGINLDATFELRTYEEVPVFHTGTLITTDNDSEAKEYCVEFELPKHFLNAGNYYFKLIFGEDQRIPLYVVPNIIGFEVENVKLGKNISILPGIIRPDLDFKVF